MIELILITSLCLIFINEKISNKAIVSVGIRTFQIVVSSYCLYRTSVGPSAAFLGTENPSILFFFIGSALVSFDIERLSYKRHVKELIFLLTTILLISSNLGVVVLTTLLICIVYILERRTYFIDYISLLIISLIGLIYFSELSSTVLTIKDSYYLYLTEVSELIFYPLITLFVLVEFSRLNGLKRNISTVLILVPMTLAYKFKLANNFEQDLATVMSPIFLFTIFLKARNPLRGKSLSHSINYLLVISLFTSFTYLVIEYYESSIATSLLIIAIFTIYRELSNLFTREVELKKITACFALFNLAAIPLSFSGLALIDILSLTKDMSVFFYLIVAMIISLVTFSFTLKSLGDDLYVNLLEGSNKVKIATASLFITSLTLIFLNLSHYLASQRNTKLLETLIFGNKVDMFASGLLNYNLMFIIFLIGAVVIGYFVKVVDNKLSWKVSFRLDEVLRSISLNKIELRSVATKESKVESILEDERNEVEISSFKVSFYILSIFLIISLIIIEL
ncbi:hypothetical protein [Halobacteriovorax sp.]|uniref:hypothetical protein n=1 Tax=Halobacteriovorax sp. TaxID=2020862 RepID=UPI00356415DE